MPSCMLHGISPSPTVLRKLSASLYSMYFSNVRRNTLRRSSSVVPTPRVVLLWQSSSGRRPGCRRGHVALSLSQRHPATGRTHFQRHMSAIHHRVWWDGAC